MSTEMTTEELNIKIREKVTQLKKERQRTWEVVVDLFSNGFDISESTENMRRLTARIQEIRNLQEEVKKW